MNWLNIHLATLRSPVYLGSAPVERATWLQLLAYCADQENGGCIAGAALWKDRQWQQTCGVMAREVRAASRLVSIEGNDVRVLFYPVDKEAEVQAKRQAGKERAGKRWGNNSADDSSATRTANAEGNGKEVEKEKEKNKNETHASSAAPGEPAAEAQCADDAESRGRLCSLRAAIIHGMRLAPPCPEQWASKWWEDCEKRGWVDNHGIALKSWKPALSSYWRGVQEQDRRSNSGNSVNCVTASGDGAVTDDKSGTMIAAQPPGSRWQRTMSAYEIKVRTEAIDAELGRLARRAQDGRSADGLRTVKIYAPEEEARRQQLIQAKEALRAKLTEAG